MVVFCRESKKNIQEYNMKSFQLIFILLLSWKVSEGGNQNYGYFHPKIILATHPPGSIVCENDRQCQTVIEGSKCDGICKCPDEKLLSSDGSKCLVWVSGYGDSCEDSIQCSQVLGSGGVCIYNECKCKIGFHYLNGKCWKNIDLNERCYKNEQCFSAYEYVGLICEKEICNCRSQYYARLNSGCRRKMKAGDACNLDSDCPEGSTCNSMICSDAPRNVEIVGLKNFYETLYAPNSTVELGSDCTTNTDCEGIRYAVCLDNRVCACAPPKYVASENNKLCLSSSRGKVEDIGKSSCKESAQCAVFGGNSICKDKKCACKSGTYWEIKNQFCWTIKGIGERCSVNEDCHPSETFSECKEQVCMCRKGYHQKGTICVPDATKVGDFCEEDDECLFQHSFCNESNVCACKENYYPQNGECLGGVKSSCKTDADCCHLNNTKCSSNDSSSWQCLCLDDYLSSDEGKYCLPAVQFGGRCEESFQCRKDLGEFGRCEDGICRCSSETHYYGKCYCSKFVTESCTRLQDCHPGNDIDSVICLKGFCTCNYGYEVDKHGLCFKSSSDDKLKPYFYGLLAALFLFR